MPTSIYLDWERGICTSSPLLPLGRELIEPETVAEALDGAVEVREKGVIIQ